MKQTQQTKSLEPISNLRELLSCADCKHLNVPVRHAEGLPRYAIKCARPDGPEFRYDDTLEFCYICDGFEEA